MVRDLQIHLESQLGPNKEQLTVGDQRHNRKPLVASDREGARSPIEAAESAGLLFEIRLYTDELCVDDHVRDRKAESGLSARNRGGIQRRKELEIGRVT